MGGRGRPRSLVAERKPTKQRRIQKEGRLGGNEVGGGVIKEETVRIGWKAESDG